MINDDEMTIQVNLSTVFNYINNEDFRNYLFLTTDNATALFILETLTKTIKYMLNE